MLKFSAAYATASFSAVARAWAHPGRRVRMTGCSVINASGDGIWIAGDSNPVDDAYICSLGAPNEDGPSRFYG